MNLAKEDLEKLKLTISEYNTASIIAALEATIYLYRELRKALFSSEVNMQVKNELKSVDYLHVIKTRKEVS